MVDVCVMCEVCDFGGVVREGYFPWLNKDERETQTSHNSAL
jgi:hypothetical protein